MRITSVDNWMELEQHPASAAFRPMDESEFDQLTANILNYGFDTDHPIVLYMGQVLDGWNRLRACVALNEKGDLARPPTFVEWEGTENPVNWVIRANLIRRHLTVGERAALAVEIIGPFEDAAKSCKLSNLKKGTEVPDVANLRHRELMGRSSEHVAKAVGVSPRSVQEAKKLKSESLEQFEAVKRGELTLQQAKKAARAAKNKEDRELERAQDYIAKLTPRHLEAGELIEANRIIDRIKRLTFRSALLRVAKQIEIQMEEALDVAE